MRTTVLTCSICADLTRLWFKVSSEHLDPNYVDVIICDAGANLLPEHFPGARIVPLPNRPHGEKIDMLLKRYVRNKYVFISDDDSFIVDGEAEPFAVQQMVNGNRIAAVPYRVRHHWSMDIAGKTYYPMSTCSLVFDLDVWKKEKLSFATVRTRDATVRRGTGYYDTGDFAWEQLLRRGYEIYETPRDFRGRAVLPFYGVSRAYVNLCTRRNVLVRNLIERLLRKQQTKCYVMESSSTAYVAKIKNYSDQADIGTIASGYALSWVIILYQKAFNESPRLTDFPCPEEYRRLVLPGVADDALSIADLESRLAEVDVTAETLQSKV